MRYLIGLVLWLSAYSAFSQTNFEEGYFIKNNGDTIRCLIKNIAWKNNPDSFDYKVSEGAETQTASIDDVYEFNVSNAYKFVRYTVKIDQSPATISRLDDIPEPDMKEETLFLSALVEGNAVLYKYEDGNLVRYFIKKKQDTIPQQLIYKMYKKGGSVHYNSSYIGQLYDAMKDKIKDRQVFTKLKYSKQPLINIFNQYNNGSPSITRQNKQNQPDLNIKITPGISLGNTSIFQANTTNEDYTFNNKPGFRVGVEAEYIFPFNNGKWSLFADPNFQMYNNKGKTTKDGRSYTWDIKYDFLEIPLGARYYMFLNKNSKVFVNFAYVLTPLVSKKSGIDFHSGSGFPFNAKTDFTRSSNLAAGAGFSHKKLSAELRYTFWHGIIEKTNLFGTEYSATSLIIGYKIL